MPAQADLVIRRGLVVDGSGGEPFEGDVAVDGGRIVAVGKVRVTGREEIDAKGRVVTPGFVDIHTHYDGQVTWENRLVPSSSHGVTTVVMGNCGVGFAPCRREQRGLLIDLMEGVEDIPHAVLADGVPWEWESYPEYLDFLAGRRFDADVCGYLPHSALRVYVMGRRGADREPATPADLDRMSQLLRDAVAAGAMGFSTSRSIFHRSVDGRSIPTFEAAERELTALALTLRACGRGAMQMITDFDTDAEAAFGTMRRLVQASGRPLSFTLFEGARGRFTNPWRRILDWVAAANADGLPMKGQVIGRAIGLMFGHELTLNPFFSTDGYRALLPLPFDQRIAQLRRPEVRERILSEPIDPDPANFLGTMVRDFDGMFLLGDPPNYEPDPDASVGAEARRRGVRPEALAYDLMLEREGRNLLYYAIANYEKGSLDVCREMMRHPHAVLGLGDGGAHCGTICDGSAPTFMLTHWARYRREGRLPLPWIVRALSAETASAVGLLDRGLVAPGFKADLNVIDVDRLALHAPEVAYDLPGGGRRLAQRAEGYAATIVDGAVVQRDGTPTGALPGRLVRGPQQAHCR